MKNNLNIAAILSFAMLLNGCQNADDSSSSEEDQNTVAMNDVDSGGSSGPGEGGSGSGPEGGNSDSAPGSGGPGFGSGAPGAGGNIPGGGPAGYGSDPLGAGGDISGAGGNLPGADGNIPGADGNIPGADGNIPGAGPAGYGSGAPGAGGNIPGADGGVGGYGGYGGGQGGGVPTYKEGTAENAVIKTWSAIRDGKLQGLTEFISSRAIGDLAKLRNGKLSKEKLDELKQQMAEISLRTRTSGSTKTVSLKNREGRIFRFTCKKEKGKYLIQKFENKAPTKRKRRGR